MSTHLQWQELECRKCQELLGFIHWYPKTPEALCATCMKHEGELSDEACE